jgi:hypothetical protein
LSLKEGFTNLKMNCNSLFIFFLGFFLSLSKAHAGLSCQKLYATNHLDQILFSVEAPSPKQIKSYISENLTSSENQLFEQIWQQAGGDGQWKIIENKNNFTHFLIVNSSKKLVWNSRIIKNKSELDKQAVYLLRLLIASKLDHRLIADLKSIFVDPLRFKTLRNLLFELSPFEEKFNSEENKKIKVNSQRIIKSLIFDNTRDYLMDSNVSLNNLESLRLEASLNAGFKIQRYYLNLVITSVMLVIAYQLTNDYLISPLNIDEFKVDKNIEDLLNSDPESLHQELVERLKSIKTETLNSEQLKIYQLIDQELKRLGPIIK